MSASYSRFGKVCGLGCSVIFGASGLVGAELVLQKVPPLTVEQAPAYPQNLARHRLGAQVETVSASAIDSRSMSKKQNDAETALLSDDPTARYTLPEGTTTLLISLSRIENVETISFLNDGAKGALTIATANAKLSAASAQWHKVSQQELSSKSFAAKIGPAEAKYIRLTFDVTEPGNIAGLGVYSTAGVADFTMPRANRSKMTESQSIAFIGYNVTDLHAKARALYVSSGSDLKQANNMIDEQASSSYAFASDDATPTAVIDLGKPTTLHRISAIYSAQKGKIDFYVLQSLPGTQATSAGESAPAVLRFNDAVQGSLKPVGSVTDDGSGRAAIDFPSTTGRYVMVTWNAASQPDASFSIAEIAAIGSGQSANLMASNAGGSGRELVDSDGKTVLDAKDGKDAKDYKEMPAEGPEAPAEGPSSTLPDPPPFTFVPEVVPTSQ